MQLSPCPVPSARAPRMLGHEDWSQLSASPSGQLPAHFGFTPLAAAFQILYPTKETKAVLGLWELLQGLGV